MDKKLTLSLNQSIIEEAKQYAKTNGTSLSKLIESYLGSLLKQNVEKRDITPLVKSLSGVMTIPENFDEKKEYSNYIFEKYK